MAPKSLATLLVCLCIYLPCLSQDSVSVLDKITGFPDKFFAKVSNKAATLESKLDKQTEKYLERLLRNEKKLRRKLARKDSAAAAELFDNIEEQYATSPNLPLRGDYRSTEYFAHLDTLKTSLSFLEQNSEVISSSENVVGKVQGSLKQVNVLQSKLQQSDQVKAFINRRRELIRQTLSRYTKLPKSISRTYQDLNKDVYYYSQQVREYKELLNNPDRLTEKALHSLTKLNVVQQFIRENSQLASLFRMPANPTTATTLTGFQTRAQVQQLLQTQFAASGSNAAQALQQNMQSAQQQLAALKNKMIKLGNNGSGEMPDFKPNNQKTKSFLQRLEVGTNLQSTKSNFFFPVTTDLGLSVGYKLNDKSVIGLGGSYKVGWGKDIRHIVITSEGAGLRSFVDVQLKGSFFVSGGYEYNYQGFAGADSAGINLQANSWTQSGLVGISKTISLKTKFFKKTKMQLLWDFMSYQQVPRTQALKFRVGYSF